MKQTHVAGLVVLMLLGSLPFSAAEPQPITIVASTQGRFGLGRSWSLAVDAQRIATLRIETSPKPVLRTFKIAPKEIEKLARALEKERFYDLKPSYGQIVPDGSIDTLTVVRGNQTKTVKIHFLMNWVHAAPEKLKEPARAVRIFRLIREWFSDPEAVDLRKYDDMVLRAASKG